MKLIEVLTSPETEATTQPGRSALPSWAASTEYIWLKTADGAKPVPTVINGALFMVTTDGLGTPRRLHNETGATYWQWRYNPFGEEAPTIGHYRFADLSLNPNPGTVSYAGSVTFNLRYPGQYYDAESGLNYNYFRTYDGKTGRYTQADPIGLEGGWNRFGYTNQNPLSRSDPFGLLTLPNNPSGLPSDWAPDPTHRAPNGERYRHPGGDTLDWHKGTPGANGYEGKDHWHHNGGKWHYLPGSDVPDPQPTPPPASKEPICGGTCKQVLINTWDAAKGLFILTLLLLCTTS